MHDECRHAALIGAALWGALAGAPSAAQAYCQATDQPMDGACPSPCPTGMALAWGTPEIEYALNRSSFLGRDETAFRGAIARSFAHWSDVRCNGVATGFAFAELPQRTDLTVGPDQQEPNLNVISELSATDWAGLGFDSHAFAKTQLWFDTKSGEILGSDIAFNAGIGTFAVCSDVGCPPNVVDLENVATHEIGHFLGLAHSAERSATMWCDSVKGDLGKKTLDADDEAGLCAIYGSHAVFLDPAAAANGPLPSPPSMASVASGGCSLGGNHDSAASALPMLTLLALVLRRRKL